MVNEVEIAGAPRLRCNTSPDITHAAAAGVRRLPTGSFRDNLRQVLSSVENCFQYLQDKLHPLHDCTFALLISSLLTTLVFHAKALHFSDRINSAATHDC
jgi:hypothetical protein